MYILGISAFYHDSAAALLKDGEIIAAAQEERFTRKKHDPSFPSNAIDYCLGEANIAAEEIDHVVFYEKPFLKFERLLETYLAFSPRGFSSFRRAIPVWVKEKLFQKDYLRKEFAKQASGIDWQDKLLFAEHHQSHAASAFFPSPFNEAIVLTMDGVGEWTTTSVAIGNGNKLDIVKEIHFPHSIGLLYSAFTYYTGFRVNSGEYKLMGLAPYGTPIYKETILEKLIDLKQDGSFRLDLSYFDYCTGLTMTNKKFSNLFGKPARLLDKEPLEQFHMDIAASIQSVCEEIVLRITRSLSDEFGHITNLCLAGGVALNCVANGEILRDRRFKNVWIQPAAGDAGGALGAAFAAYHEHLGQKRLPITGTDAMKGSYLGPSFSSEEIEQRLTSLEAVFHKMDKNEIIEKTAINLASGKAIGWMQGKMEFGPRALGRRSIIADPRSEKMQKILNLKVKYRESFRPFAPSVLREDVQNWFQLSQDSPYMLIVADVAADKQKQMTQAEKQLFGIDKLNVSRSDIPAVTHVDYSARIQTVHKETNTEYHSLISTFKKLTGCPVLVNTSFNVRGEPIVCTPEDAFRCFMGTELDILVIDNFYMIKEEQNKDLKEDYAHRFKLD